MAHAGSCLFQQFVAQVQTQPEPLDLAAAMMDLDFEALERAEEAYAKGTGNCEQCNVQLETIPLGQRVALVRGNGEASFVFCSEKCRDTYDSCTTSDLATPTGGDPASGSTPEMVLVGDRKYYASGKITLKPLLGSNQPMQTTTFKELLQREVCSVCEKKLADQPDKIQLISELAPEGTVVQAFCSVTCQSVGSHPERAEEEPVSPEGEPPVKPEAETPTPPEAKRVYRYAKEELPPTLPAPLR